MVAQPTRRVSAGPSMPGGAAPNQAWPAILAFIASGRPVRRAANMQASRPTIPLAVCAHAGGRPARTLCWATLTGSGDLGVPEPAINSPLLPLGHGTTPGGAYPESRTFPGVRSPPRYVRRTPGTGYKVPKLTGPSAGSISAAPHYLLAFRSLYSSIRWGKSYKHSKRNVRKRTTS